MHFALALAISEILVLQMFNLQKVGHGHGVEFLQRDHSMANIKIYKSQCIFALTLILSEILTFQVCNLHKVDQGHGV